MSKSLRRVLMFHGSRICNNTLNIFSDRVAEELRLKGIEVGFIDLDKQGDCLADEYVREMNLGFDCALAFNSCGQHETTMVDDNVFEYMNVPFFNWILDHPCEHTADILSDLKKYHIICLDRDHVNYVRHYFPKIAAAHFIPLGGEKPYMDADYSKNGFNNRKYDISFTGSCFSLEELGGIIGNLPEELRSAATDMIEYMIDNRSANNEEAFRYAFAKNKIRVNIDAFRQYAYQMAKTNPFVRSYIRQEVIMHLAGSGIRMELFGSGWDHLVDKGNITIHGNVSYQESIQYTAESRISFNVMPLFKDGLHDRIPTAMLCGSAVMTDGSRYIEEILDTHGRNREVILYDIDHPEQIADNICENLNDIEGLYKIAERGRKKAEKILTWEVRVEQLIRAMEEACG